MSGMKWVLPFLVLLGGHMGGHTSSRTAQNAEDGVLELSPSDFVSLEVGNRWTFSHEYVNEMYWRGGWREWDEDDKAYFRQFEIPGYPFGGDDPPDSLTRPAPAFVTVEITHTEMIEGNEYFVFSGPPYSWPPLPMFFWAGQKVRLSNEGILYFFGVHEARYRPSVDNLLLPLYDFRVPSYENNYTVHPDQIDFELPWGPFSDRIEVVRFMSTWLHNPKFPGHPFYRPKFPVIPDHLDLDMRVNPLYRDKVLEIIFTLDSNPLYWDESDHFEASFVYGYGLGLFKLGEWGPDSWSRFLNILYPVSAVLSGKEVSYEEATEELVTLAKPDPIPVVGQRDTIHTLFGFDFSEGVGSDPLLDSRSDLELVQIVTVHGDAGGPPAFVSIHGMADFGRADFGRLISNGTADLEPDPPRVRGDWAKRPQEGHVYAFWTREGGIALTHVIEIVTAAWSPETVVYVLIDWKYFPPSSPDTSTSVTPTSWGELKNFICGAK